MGSKTRIALSQLQSPPETQPDPHEWANCAAPEEVRPAIEEEVPIEEGPAGESAETRREAAAETDTEETDAETGEVIPAFPPFRASERPAPAEEEEAEQTERARERPEPESGMPASASEARDGEDGDAATAGVADSPVTAGEAEAVSAMSPRPEEPEEEKPEDRDAPDEAWASDSGGAEILSDPELLALLEQLSETLDNANRILAERPASLAPAADEYAGIEEAETPASREAAEQGLPPAEPRSGLMPAALTTAVFLIVAGGGFWWFQTNPWLLEGWRNGNTALSVTHKDGTRLASLQPAGELGIPVPRAAIPSARRASERDAATAGDAPEKTRESPAAANRTDGRTQTAALPEPAASPARTAERTDDAQGYGPAGEPIDLGLALPSSKADVEISVMVQGVPEGARLSHGSEIGGGAWVLEEKDVEKAALVTPASFPPQDMSLEIAYVKSDGKIPESRSIDVVVEPARASAEPTGGGPAAGDAGTSPPLPKSAGQAARDPAAGGTPPAGADKPEPVEKTLANTAIPAAPAAAAKAPPDGQSDEGGGNRLSEEEEKQMLDRAQKYLELGDIASTRLILEHAARQGSRRAMIALGETYDPKHLAKHAIHGVRSDINQAMAWYERASRLADR